MLNPRAQNLVAALPAGFQAALITTQHNRFYLLDFDAGDAGTLLLLPGRMVYVIDSRYIESARREITCAEVVLEQDALAQINEILQRENVRTLHIENCGTIAGWQRMQEKFQNVEFDISSTLSKALATLRQVKDDTETARMRAAQRITDACFTHILPFVKEGVREVDLMLEMEHYMRSHGAQKVAFDTICVAGPNTSLPHGEPGDYKIRPGDFITFDFGARVDGYCADMTRTVALGEPGPEKRRVYDVVLRAHLAGIAAARAGVMGSAVDKVARDIIFGADTGGAFGHGLGHSVGIEIHEEPRFSPKCHDIIPAGAMITVEPGLYLEGRFGCRIEDTVRITADGCEPLPQSPKELIVL